MGDDDLQVLVHVLERHADGLLLAERVALDDRAAVGDGVDRAAGMEGEQERRDEEHAADHQHQELPVVRDQLQRDQDHRRDREGHAEPPQCRAGCASVAPDVGMTGPEDALAGLPAAV